MTIKLLYTLCELKLRQFNNVTEIQGVSMEPLIYEGNSIFVEKRPSYNIGDIIVFVDQQCRLLTHRLVRIEGDMHITKGDNTVGIDESLISNCVGIVTKIYYTGKNGKPKELYPYNKSR